MRSIFRKLIPSILLALILSGCYDAVELESRSFVISLGIDAYDSKIKQPEPDKPSPDSRFTVSTAFPDPSALNDKSGKKGELVKAVNGQTILSAISLINSFSNNVIYFGQTKLVVLGKEILSSPELLKESIDVLERNSEFSRRISVLAADRPAKDILEAKIAGEPFVGMFLSNFFKSNANTSAISFRLDLEKLIRSLRINGSAIIPMISYTKPEKEDKSEDSKDGTSQSEEEIKLGGAAVIKNFKLAGWLNDSETRGMLYVKENVLGARLAAKCEDFHTSIRIDKIRTKINFQENNDSQCVININLNCAVEEFYFMHDKSLDADKLIEIANEYERIITGEILKANDKFLEYETDGFGLIDILRKKHNYIYKRYENQLDSYLANLEIIPMVSMEITGTGTIN